MGPSSISSRKAAMSSSFQRVGRHMRGDWLNTCMASHPRSTARPWAFTRPPAVETWAPISTAARSPLALVLPDVVEAALHEVGADRGDQHREHERERGVQPDPFPGEL